MSATVLGGGITGLSAAWKLLQYDSIKSIRILEASNRLGGWIKTKKGSVIAEQGAFSISINKASASTFYTLTDDLGISDDVIKANKQASRVLRKGQISKIGVKLSLLLRVGSGFLFNWRSVRGAETLHEALLAGGLTSDEVEYSAGAFIRGIYGADIKQWENVEWAKLLRRHPKADSSRKLGMLSFRQGNEHLVEALKTKLLNDGRVTIEYEHEVAPSDFSTDYVISTLPIPELELLLKRPFDFKYQTLTVVNFCFESCDAPKDITGYLIPESEGLDVCGVFLAGNVFGSHGNVINVVLAGEHEDPVAIAQGELKRMKMSSEPVEVHVRVCRDAIPMYYVGHREKVRIMREQLESNRFVLAGAAFDGIGIPNCIKSGIDAVVRLGIKSNN